ncbi:hypothetical protein BT63DRAFT_458336 [Microthyrium microscopicum]|uniref:Zn(2)-C6 fungal-type domain-containing protein n=1 Tax=Microthyrium microscopicum TaxID=703497 RepID=A0A6A6U1I4_9PEZI|nr:hypothetical protein BT63DRAFT_458336 [Microthyrium microscopicum]
MSYLNSFDDVDNSFDGSGGQWLPSPKHESPDLTSPMEDHPAFSLGSNYDIEFMASPFLSPEISASEVDSNPGSLQLPFDLSSGIPKFGFNHSFPGAGHFHQHMQHSVIAPDLHNLSEQEQYGDWGFDVLMSQENPLPYFDHLQSQSSAATNRLDLNHVPRGWAKPTRATSTNMSRTESVLSGNSVESYASGQSWDDFHAEHSPEDETLPEDCRPLLSPSNNSRLHDTDWPSNASNADSMDNAANPKAVPIVGNTMGKQKKGRTGKLTEEQRASAASVRKIGACMTCRKRRARCDEGIPCRSCRRYFRNNPKGLAENPCRGEALHNVADYILRQNAFPKGPFNRFLSKDYVIEPTEYDVLLDFGFGNMPFSWKVKLLRAKSGAGNHHPFMHKHVEYPWPPQPGRSIKLVRDDLVFPGVLSEDTDIIAQVEIYLTKLLDNRNQFTYFPLWRSKLKVLRVIYKYYLSLPSNHRKPLKQALQLLILVHVGGDVRLIPGDPVAEAINARFFPGLDHEKVTPCFIRAQLGPIFSTLAHTLMGSVLKQLEQISQSQDSRSFPMIISTFSALFLALESLQYHFEKEAYHSHHDEPGYFHDDSSSTRDLATFEVGDVLLRFYKATQCHASLRTLYDLAAQRQRDLGGSLPKGYTSLSKLSVQVAGDERTTAFMYSLFGALVYAGPYLVEKVQMDTIVSSQDMSCFFDRQLAKMYLLEPTDYPAATR